MLTKTELNLYLTVNTQGITFTTASSQCFIKIINIQRHNAPGFVMCSLRCRPSKTPQQHLLPLNNNHKTGQKILKYVITPLKTQTKLIQMCLTDSTVFICGDPTSTDTVD